MCFSFATVATAACTVAWCSSYLAFKTVAFMISFLHGEEVTIHRVSASTLVVIHHHTLSDGLENPPQTESQPKAAHNKFMKLTTA